MGAAGLWISQPSRSACPTTPRGTVKQLHREAIVVAVFGLAPIALIVAVATGAIEAEEPEWVYLFSPMISIGCAGSSGRIWRFNRPAGRPRAQ